LVDLQKDKKKLDERFASVVAGRASHRTDFSATLRSTIRLGTQENKTAPGHPTTTEGQSQSHPVQGNGSTLHSLV
jgi:hypothetical protein